MQLELDCWASVKSKRDSLARDLRRQLNRSPSTTLGGGVLGLDHEAGLVLPVPGLFNQPCYYEFVPVPSVGESSDAAQTNEWRSHWRGTAEMSIVDQQLFTLIKRIGLQMSAAPSTLGTLPRELVRHK
jgi:hypothetical protein